VAAVALLTVAAPASAVDNIPAPDADWVGCRAHADDVMHWPRPFPLYPIITGNGEVICKASFDTKVRVGLQQRKVNRFWPDDWITVWWATRWTPWKYGTYHSQEGGLVCNSRRDTHWRVVVLAKMVNEYGHVKRSRHIYGDQAEDINCREPYVWAGSGR
jgi:hypothetical protein